MKKATRILALVLCAVMCLGLFVGCGNKGKQNSDTPLVVGYSPFNSKFSPFFSETAYDQDVWTMTGKRRWHFWAWSATIWYFWI